MNQAAGFLRWGAWLCLAVSLLAAPWFFGGWEIWWFWSLLIPILVASGMAALSLIINPGWIRVLDIESRVLSIQLCIWYSVFVVYSFLSMRLAPVHMPAERAFLLVLIPLLIGLMVLFCFSRRQIRILVTLMAVNIGCEAIYGLANHVVTGSSMVMWAPGFPQYYTDGRASGSFYCPNHFAGMLVMGLCLAGGFGLSRSTRPVVRWLCGLLALLCIAGIVISKSRGGMISSACALLVLPFLAGVQWTRKKRRKLMLGFAAGLVFISVLTALLPPGKAAVARLISYWPDQAAKESSVYPEFWVRFRQGHSRPVMFEGAYHAWRTAPILGIGGGMHEVIWPAVAAGIDGDREQGIWPIRPYDGYHSYYVHNDWLQLLEEYGLVGMGLFLIFAGVGVTVLIQGIRIEVASRGGGEGEGRGGRAPFGMIQASIIFVVALSVHSIGDFNLHIPANNWSSSFLIAAGLAAVLRSPAPRRRRS